MALNLITTSPELLTVALKSKKRKPDNDYNEQVQVLTGMGFSRSIALGTLMETNGNLDKAIENCISGKGIEAQIDEEPLVTNPEPSTPVSINLDPQQQLMTQSLIPENIVQVGNLPEISNVPMEIDPIQQEKELEMQAAEDDLIRDVDYDADSYLDVSLEEEEATLTEYNSLLTAINQTNK